jgi:hypothetical protein
LKSWQIPDGNDFKAMIDGYAHAFFDISNGCHQQNVGSNSSLKERRKCFVFLPPFSML